VKVHGTLERVLMIIVELELLREYVHMNKQILLYSYENELVCENMSKLKFIFWLFGSARRSTAEHKTLHHLHQLDMIILQ
jgi:hypothetical protein